MKSKEINNKKITVFNKISSNYRELHVDGAYGGITPKGLFNMNFYAERLAIPKATDFKILKGKLEKIIDSTDSKSGIIREFETGIYMTIDSAREIYKWMGEILENFETNQKTEK